MAVCLKLRMVVLNLTRREERFCLYFQQTGVLHPLVVKFFPLPENFLTRLSRRNLLYEIFLQEYLVFL